MARMAGGEAAAPRKSPPDTVDVRAKMRRMWG